MRKENARARLLENYGAEEHGTWTIYGEDHNTDLTGPHDEPKLEVVTGTYKNVVEYALTLGDFFTWGRGGRIQKKTCQSKLLNVDTLVNPKVLVLQSEKTKLRARLEAIDEEIQSLTNK